MVYGFYPTSYVFSIPEPWCSISVDHECQESDIKNFITRIITLMQNIFLENCSEYLFFVLSNSDRILNKTIKN